MRTRGRLLRVTAAPLVLAGALTGLLAPAASAASCQGWPGGQPPSVSGNFGSQLNGVTVVSACDVWAAGSTLGSVRLTPLIEHWTGGSSWAVVPAAIPDVSSSVLNSIHAVSPTDIWAVGYTEDPDGNAQQTLTEHWDGSAWTQVASPSPGRFSELKGVYALAANDTWAVGEYGDGTQLLTLTLHWDGHTWTRIPSPSPGAAGNFLTSVAATGGRNVWAVGSYDPRPADPRARLTLIERWDGKAWTQVPSPSPGTTSNLNANVLTSVAATSASNAWAAGQFFDGTGHRIMILHWDGTNWTAAPVPGLPQSNILAGVAASSASDAWAVGETDGQNGSVAPLMLHWDGRAWTQLPGRSPGTADAGSLLAVAVPSAGNAWAVGTAGGTQPAPFAAPLAGVPGVQLAANLRSGALGEAGLVSGTADGPNVAAGTSPAAAVNTGGGSLIAWQAADGHLWTADSAGHATDQQVQVAAGSSPAVGALASGGFEIAFANAADGTLWQLRPGGTPQPAGGGLAIAAGTSPAVAGSPNGGFQIAFHQASTGDLWTIDPAGTGHDTGAAMVPGSSPAITGLASGGFETAFAHAGDTHLWELGPGGQLQQAATGLRVSAGTSPAITADAGGGFEIAFREPGTSDLWTIDPSNTGHDTGAKVSGGTSPAIAALPGGGFELAYHLNGTDELTTLTGGGPATGQGLIMATGTSPALAAPAPLAPPPAPTPAPTVTVPDVRGHDLTSSAQPDLTAAGLKNAVQFDNHCLDAAGVVLDQAPSPGTDAPLGSVVTLTVSSGLDPDGVPCNQE